VIKIRARVTNRHDTFGKFAWDINDEMLRNASNHAKVLTHPTVIVGNLCDVIHAFLNEQEHVRNAQKDPKLMIKFKENKRANPMENNRHGMNINEGAMMIYENNAPYERKRTYARRISLTNTFDDARKQWSSKDAKR